MTVRNVVTPAPQPQPASRLRGATRDVSFLRSDKVSAIRERPVLRYSEVFGLGTEGQGFAVEVDFQLMFGFLVVEMADCRHRFFMMLNFSSKSGGIHSVFPCPCSAPLPLPANLHQHA